MLFCPRRPLRRRRHDALEIDFLRLVRAVEGEAAQVLDDFADALRALQRALDQRRQIGAGWSRCGILRASRRASAPFRLFLAGVEIIGQIAR